MPSQTSPLNAIPPVVAALALVMGAAELILALADRAVLGGAPGIGWRVAALERYAAFDAVLEAMWARGALPPEHALRLVAYPFVHGGLVHAAFAVAMLLALGKMVGEVFAPWATATVFLVPCVAGALAWSALADDPRPLFGAFPGVYGLIGAYTFLLWTRLARAGGNRVEAFRLIGVLLAIQLVFAMLFGAGADWIADLAGFAAGFALSFLVSPGGWSAVLARLRER